MHFVGWRGSFSGFYQTFGIDRPQRLVVVWHKAVIPVQVHHIGKGPLLLRATGVLDQSDVVIAYPLVQLTVGLRVAPA